ncbi:MAG: class I SAM-dependent methyltransferase [Brevundimonas sp.]
MRRSILLACAAALALSASGCARSVPDPLPLPLPVQMMPGRDYSEILASPIRTADDRGRDEARMAGETLSFIGVQPGWKVADMIIGGGYFTRLLSAAVGPAGHVTAWQPEEFIAFQASYGEALTAADALANVDAIRSPLRTPEFPSGLDLIFTAQNYHDLHLRAFPADTASRVNSAAFAALKPGGRYVIIDHQAVDGSDLSVADELHRIDHDTVVAEVQAAGFRLSEEAALLWRDDDPRTASVFDASIRGRTSQFAIIFRKPG